MRGNKTHEHFVQRVGLEEGPIEVDSTDFEAIPAQVTLTPPSGLPPSDEWLGHVLLGYAPFGVPCRPVLPESGESAAISRR